ncbi:MAG TPA: ribosome small subunit-dependent GTPase A [Fimbriimonas sp.]
MKSQAKLQALGDRLGKMTAKDRKEITRRAAELRERAQRAKKEKVGSLEDWIARLLDESEPALGPTGTVIGVEATLCDVLIGEEIRRLPMLSGVRPVVGDEVEILRERVQRILPRRSRLGKPDDHHGGREQTLVANVDLVVVVVAATCPPLHPRLIDRYLFAIRMGGARPLICVNKMDLLPADKAASELRKLDPYREMGVPVVTVSAIRRDGLDDLRRELRGQRCAFVGHSGVGKSSVLNALLGLETNATGSVNSKTGKGRHTTTRASLHRLADGIEIIDTAGIRAFGIDERASVQDGFPDLLGYATNCRFSDCRHLDEEGCSVKEAVREGLLSRERYKAYRSLLHGEPARGEGFLCVHCGATAQAAGGGTKHRNHCPRCLWSVHLDHKPGDRLACCGGAMEPVAVWVRQDGEWAVIHRCAECGAMSSNRIAADDNEMLLLSIAVKPLAKPPFPLWSEEGLPSL